MRSLTPDSAVLTICTPLVSQRAEQEESTLASGATGSPTAAPVFGGEPAVLSQDEMNLVFHQILLPCYKPDNALCSLRGSKVIPRVLVYFPFCPIKELPKAIILCFFMTPNLCPYSSSMPSSVSCDITTCRARKSLQVRAPLLGSSFEHQGVEKVHTISHSCWGQPGLVPRGWALPGTPGSLHQEPRGKCFSTCPPLPFQGLLPRQEISSLVIPRCCR